jgi:hypothetical protein
VAVLTLCFAPPFSLVVRACTHARTHARFGHPHLTARLREVLPAMVLQVCDDEKAMSEAVCGAAMTLGGCVDPEAILAVLLPWVRCEFKEGVPVQASIRTHTRTHARTHQ